MKKITIFLFYVIAVWFTSNASDQPPKLLKPCLTIFPSLPAPTTQMTYFIVFADEDQKKKIANFRIVLKSTIEPKPELSTYSEKLGGFTKIGIQLSFTFYLQRKAIKKKNEKWNIIGTYPPTTFKTVIFLVNKFGCSLERGTPVCIFLADFVDRINFKIAPIVRSSRNDGLWRLGLYIYQAAGLGRLSYKDPFVHFAFFHGDDDSLNSIYGELLVIKKTASNNRIKAKKANSSKVNKK